MVRLHKAKGVIELKSRSGAPPPLYGLVVVDEAHHVYTEPSSKAIAEYPRETLLLLSDASQSFSNVNYPKEVTDVVELTEVVRSSKRIISAASAFQDKREQHLQGTKCAHDSQGPPLKTFLFDLDGSSRREAYVSWTLRALQSIIADFPGLSLHGRLAIVVPDESMRAELQQDLAAALEANGLVRFELVTAERSCAAYTRGDKAPTTEWLLLDTVKNMDGLERLMVLCVGLDAPIEGESDALGTRSQLYRALTRAHMLVVVVNELLHHGWLAFLANVKLKKGVKFEKDQAMAESTQAMKRARVEASRQKALEEDASKALKTLQACGHISADVNVDELLLGTTKRMQAGAPVNEAAAQTFEQWKLDQILAKLPQRVAQESDAEASETCTKSLVQCARAAVRSGSEPDEVVKKLWTQWQQLEALTRELILGPVDVKDGVRAEELESLTAEAAAHVLQEQTSSARDVVLQVMRRRLERQSVAAIPTALESVLAASNCSSSEEMRAAVARLAQSLLQSNDSDAPIAAALETDPEPGPVLLQKIPNELAATAAQTALTHWEQHMKDVVAISGELGVLPSGEHSRDRWCTLAIGSLRAATKPTAETKLCAVCEALIPPMVEMLSMRISTAAKQLLAESAKQRFRASLKPRSEPGQPLGQTPGGSLLAESVKSVCLAVQSEWEDIQDLVGKALKGRDLEASAADVQLAVGRDHFSGAGGMSSIEELVEAEVSKRLVEAEVSKRRAAEAVEQAVWDPAANSTKLGGGPLAFDPYQQTLPEIDMFADRLTYRCINAEAGSNLAEAIMDMPNLTSAE